MNNHTDSSLTDAIAEIVKATCVAYPNTQAIYLYGTWGTEYQRPDSDIDLAVLLPHDEAKEIDHWKWNQLAMEVARIAQGERADLINLRRVSVVLRKEIIAAERRIYCDNVYAADEFEMLTLSFYQKLNDERREIVASGLKSGRFYDV